MATITKLGFDITSKWNRKGIDEARADLRKFSEELRRLNGRRIKINFDIEPDLGEDFEDRLQEKAEERDLRIPVHLDPDMGGLRNKLNSNPVRAKVKLDPDMGHIRRMLNEAAPVRIRATMETDKAQLDRAAADQLRSEMKLYVDDEKASMALEKMRMQMGALRETIDIDVNLQAQAANAKLEALRMENEYLPMFLDLDIALAEAKVEQMKARTRAINMKADVDTRVAEARIALMAARQHRVELQVEADTLRAEAQLAAVARDRTANIHVNSNGVLVTTAIRFGARAALASVAALTGAFFLLGQVGASVGALLAAALGGGVIAAGIAAIQVNKKLTESHNDAAAAAQRQADTAKSALSSAYQNAAATAQKGARSIAQAQDRVTRTARQGAQAVAAAESRAAGAARTTLTARRRLTDAYEDQKRAIEDLRMEIQGMGVDERSAEIAVKRAMEARAKLGQDGEPVSLLDIEEADNNIDQALQRLDEVRQRNERLREQGRKHQQEGIEGSERVVDAKQAVLDAEQAEAEAVQNVANARQDAADANAQAQERLAQAVEDAAEANARAQQQIAEAQGRVAEAQDAVNKAQEKQNGLMAQAARFFAEVAAPLQGPLNNALLLIKSRLDELKPLLETMFRNAGPLVMPLTEGLLGLAQNALPGVNQALAESVPIMNGFRDGISQLGADIGAMFTGLTAGAEGLGQTWRVWGTRFGEFLRIMGEGFGRMAGDAAVSLDKTLAGINALVGGMLNGLAPALEHMAGGTSLWFSLFNGIGKFFEIAGPAIGQFTQALSNALGPAMDQTFIALAQLTAAFLTGLVPVLQALQPFLLAAANGLTAIVNALGPHMGVIAPIVAGLWMFRNVIGVIWAVTGPLSGALRLLVGGFTALRTAMLASSAAMLANPVGLIVVAIAAAAAAITLLITKTDLLDGVLAKLGEWGSKIWNLLGPAFSRIGDAFKSALESVKQTWETHIKPALDGLGAALGPLWQELQPILAMVGGALLAIANVALGIVEHSIKPVFNAIGGFIGGVINVIKGGVQVLTGILQGIKGTINVIVGVFQMVVAIVKGVFTGDWSGLEAAWNRILNGLKGIGNGVLNIIRGFVNILKGAWDAAYAVVSGAIGLIVGVVRGFIQGIIGFFQWLYDVLVGHSIVPDLMNAIVGWFKRLWEMASAPVKMVVDLVVNSWNWIFQKVSEILGWIRDKWDDFWKGVDFIREHWREIIENAWNAFWDRIKSFFTGIVDWVKNKWDDFWKGIDFIREHWRQIIETAWNRFWDNIKNIATGIWDKIREAWDTFKTKFTEAFDALVTKAEEIWNKIKGIFATPINFVIGIWNDHIADKIGMGDKKLSKIEGYAEGGVIPGAGLGRTDSRLARVSSGEYIVNERAATANRPLLDAINYGQLPKFREGGAVEWMTDWVKGVSPSMQVTSTYRDTADHHGSGKAADFAMPMTQVGLTEMFNLAQNIASTWGAKTLELIHANGFQNNIKDGQNVGDGFGFYGTATMGQHQNHVHWAVPGPLNEQDEGKSGLAGLFDKVGDVVGGVVNTGRQLVSSLFKRMTDPLINGIPDPFIPGMGSPFGGIPKGFATTVRANVLDFIRGKEGAGHGSNLGPMGGMIPEGERLAIIEEAMRITGTPPPDGREDWLRGMNTLITRESGWNAGAVNNWDSNAAAGTPSGGLAQVIGPTFEAHKAPGYDNLMDPVSNVAASINYIKARYGSIHNVQQANANMPPKGYADGTKRAKPGWHLVGEEGPEMVKFKGGEEVVPAQQTMERIKNVKLEERAPKAMGDFFQANLDQFKSDIGAGDVGNGVIPQLFKQGLSYGTKLAQQGAQTHFHVGNMDEALRKYKQRQREQGYSLD